MSAEQHSYYRIHCDVPGCKNRYCFDFADERQAVLQEGSAWTKETVEGVEYYFCNAHSASPIRGEKE
jgi:hypothetical protein